MLKFAKIVNDGTKACEIGLGTNSGFYKSLGFTEMDVEQGYDELWYLAGHAPQKSLGEARAAKLAALDAAFTTASETAHCMASTGFEVNADEIANRNISSLIIATEATGAGSVRFCAYDNRFHDVTLAQLKTLQLEIIANAQAIYQRREQINAAETVEKLEAIVITFDEGEDNEQTA